MPYSAGTAYLQVIPSFRDVQRGLEEVAEQIGRRVDEAVSQGMRDGARNGARQAQRDMERAGGDGGKRYGSAFERSWRRHLTEGYRNLPEIELDANTRPIDRAMHRVREQMSELSDRSLEVDFDEREAIRDLQRIGSELRRLERDATSRRDIMNLRAARGEVEALSAILRDARRRGAIAGGEYGQAAERAVRKAIGHLPEVRLDLDPSEFNRRLDKVRADLASIASSRIGIEIDDAQFRAKLEAAERELERLDRMAPSVQLRSDVARARATLREFLQREIPGVADDSGERAGGAFARSFNARIRAALNHTPEITPNTNISPSMRRLQQIRAEIERLDSDNIDLNVDSAAAMQRVRALHAELVLLTRTNPDINVRVDAARAAAELAALIREAQHLDGMNIDIDVDTHADRAASQMRRLGNDIDIPIHRLGVLIALGFAIGPAIVPAAAAASVALAGLATAAGAAVLGVGVLALGFSGVFTAVKALGKAQEDADKTAKALSQSQTAIANALDGVASAERGLANTRAQVESARRRAAKAVEDAEKGVTEAVEERQRAEEALADAIKAAQKADEDRRLSIRGVALDIRQANLDIAEAKAELDKVMNNPRATEEEREQARITYEQRVLQLDELTLRQSRLAEEQAKWNKEGVKGSDEYKNAQERVQDATDGVAKAQDRLAEALEAQKEQQRQGSYQLQQATQAVAQAQRSLAQAYTNAGTAGGEAFRNVQKEMAKLSPAGQEFAKFVFGLKDEFQQLRFAAQEGMFPGFTRGLQELMTYLPGVTAFVGDFARAIGESFEWAVKQMSHPQWREFFSHMRQSAIPAFQGLLQFTEKVSRALATLIVTLSPFNRSMGEGLLAWAEGFATWADKLSESTGFQNFLAYVRVAGPDVLHLLGEMFEFVKRFVIAAAPVGTVVVGIFTALFEALNAIPLDVLSKLVGLIAAFSAIMLLNKAAMVLWRVTAGTMRATVNGLMLPFRTYQRVFVGINGALPLTTQAQMAWTRALGRSALAIAPVYAGVTRLYGVLRGPVIGAATATWGGLTTAWSRAGAVLVGVQTRLAAMYATMRTGVVSAATTAQRIYNTALTDARIIAALAATQASRYFTVIRTMPAVTSAASAAQRIYNTALTDARIIGALATSQLSRFFTAIRVMPAVTSAASTAQRIYNTALTDARIIGALASAQMARLATSFTLGTIATSASRTAVSLAAGAMGAFTTAAGAAMAATGRFTAALVSLGTAAAGGALRSLSGLAMFLGGPWGIALAVATLGITALVISSQRAKQAIQNLKDGMRQFADVFEEGFTPASYEAAEALLRQDASLRKLVGTLRQAGFDTRQIVAAINGEKGARQAITAALDEQIRLELHQAAVVRQGADHETVASQKHKDRAEALKKMKEALEAAGVASEDAQALAEALRVQDVATEADQKALNESFRDGARAVDILRNAYKQLYGEAQTREEALEAERAAFDALTESVRRNGATLDVNTEAGRENRKNMRERIEALGDLAAADIAATGQISADTQARIDKLRAEMIQMGFNSEEVDRMIKLYMGVPPKILTEIILNGGANAQGVLNETGKKALEMIATYNLSPSEAMIIAKGGIPPGWRGPSPSALAQAEGGFIRGPGTTTSDSIPALLSDREFVEPAHAVAHYGVPVFEALRQKRIPKEHLAGYARGGLVDATGRRRFALGGYTGEKGSSKANVMGVASWPILHAYADKLWREKAAELERLATAGGDFGPGPGFPPWPRSPGASRGDSGVWRSIVHLIRSTGPFSGSFGNAYRHGDPLWHGSGRAVDWMGFNQDRLAEFFFARRGQLLEFIHRTNKRDYAVTRGKDRGSFSQGLMQAHRNHIHVAMDQGGWLTTGWNPPIWNGTGSPEAVLTPPQSAALVSIARRGEMGGGGPRVVNNFQFRDTTLDASKLRAMNAAEAAYARVGRAR